MKQTRTHRPAHKPLWAACIGVLMMGTALQPAEAADAGLPTCSGTGPVKVLLEKQGALESIAFDRQGRLLLSDILGSRLLRMDAPSASPVTVASAISFPGGIAVTSDRDAYIGTGNSPVNGLLPSLGGAGIAHVDLSSGVVTPTIQGLSMSNGVVRASDGTFYASDDLARSLDRVLPDGTVQRGWLPLNSNGLALSRDQKTLYVNQMLPAKILAVERATGAVRLVAEAPKARTWTWLDGLAIDAEDTLYVVAYWGGEVWRLAKDGNMCLLASGLSMPSAVVVGQAGSGFSATSVYITTHSGRLHEVPHAVPPMMPAP
ncbi:MAG: SMP-30/gluconolactonase/LRE family protein [Aquabacterium sp.]